MLSKQHSEVMKLAILVALATIVQSLSASFNDQVRPVLAQSDSEPAGVEAPTQGSDNTPVQLIDATRSAPFSPALKQRFEQQFPGAKVDIAFEQAGVQAILDQTVDLAAISRSLTPAEKDQGLVQVPIAREKIAIVVGAENPFQQNLTIDQFAKIVRGEITDWSQVGGAPGAIRLIEASKTSNTRGALQQYTIFQNNKVQTGATSAPDSQAGTTANLAQALGADGISYAPISQIATQKQLRTIAMYGTLADDDRYPFSQPYSFVYKGTPNPSAQAFLVFATSSQAQQAIAQAKTQPAISEATLSSSSVSSDSGIQSGASEAPQDSTAPTSPSSPSPTSPAGGTDSSDLIAQSNPAAVESPETGNQLGWLPVGLTVLVLGGLAVGVAKSRGAGRPSTPPRPAPNYAEKMGPRRDELAQDAQRQAHAQASGTQIQASGTQIQEPGTEIQEPGTQIQESGTEIQESGTEIQEHQTHLQHPDAPIQDPKTQIQ